MVKIEEKHNEIQLMIVTCLKFIISLRGGHCDYSLRAKKNGKCHKKRKCRKLSIFAIRTEFLVCGFCSLTVAIENVPNNDNHRAVLKVYE